MMSNEDKAPIHFDSDEPIKTDEDDNYNFSQIAEKMSSTVLSHDLQKGIVIGITGPWGSGKTSLFNLISRRLSCIKDDISANSPVILKFSPWLVGNRDTLLSSFLPLLATTVSKHNSNKIDLSSLYKYATIISTGIQNVNTFVGMTTGMKLPLLNEALSLGDDVLESLYKTNDTKGLDQLKDEATEALRKAKVPVIVLLDDIDRLEPLEVLNLLRLVRSTARFPFVSYILTYDEEKVIEIINHRLGTNGLDYLEKIRQISIRVPQISPILLSKKLHALIHNLVVSSEKYVDLSKSELKSTILSLSNFEMLKLPRDVSRFYNEFLLLWLMNNANVNPVDLIQITALQVKHKNLYKWIRNYMIDYYTITKDIGYVDPSIIEAARAKCVKTLYSACEEDSIDTNMVSGLLENLIPGFANAIALGTDPQTDSSKSSIECFNKCQLKELESFRKERRLASEEHWRYYFSYYDGISYFTDSEVTAFLKTTENTPDLALKEFHLYGETLNPDGENRAGILIDELLNTEHLNVVSIKQKTGLLELLSNSIDSVGETLANEPYEKRSLFIKAMNLAIEVLRNLPSKERLKTVLTLIDHGASESWISFLFHRIVILRERVIDEYNLDPKGWFSDSDFNEIKKVSLSRIRELTKNRDLVFKMHEPKWFFYLWLDLCKEWKDGSEFDKLQKWVEASTEDDEYFIKFLRIFVKPPVSRVSGQLEAIEFADVKKFLDLEATVERLKKIVAEGQSLDIDAQKILDDYNSWSLHA